MALEAHYEIRDGYLFAQVTGNFDHSSAHGLLHRCIEQARRHGLHRVLCDSTLITGLELDAASFWDHVEIGEFAAHALPKDIMVAVLETPRQLFGGRIAEDVMIQRGARIMVTSKLQDALEWLGVASTQEVDSKEGQSLRR